MSPFRASVDWHAGLTPPPDRPARGEPLYDFLARRLIDSWHLPAGVAQYYHWMNLPDGTSRRSPRTSTGATRCPSVW
ncbi:MAG: hypothetical protein M3042_05770 [Actinomycetota bacterium]|nr:hypothetical protein [Actinomycetota bacterium]